MPGFDPALRRERLSAVISEGAARRIASFAIEKPFIAVNNWMAQHYPGLGAAIRADLAGCDQACKYCMILPTLKYPSRDSFTPALVRGGKYGWSAQGRPDSERGLFTPDEAVAAMAALARDLRAPSGFDLARSRWRVDALPEGSQPIPPDRIALRLTTGEPLITPDWVCQFATKVLSRTAHRFVLDTHMVALADEALFDRFRRAIAENEARVRVTGHVLGLTPSVLRLTTSAVGEPTYTRNLDGLTRLYQLSREKGMALHIVYDCYVPRPPDKTGADVPAIAAWRDDAQRPRLWRESLESFFLALQDRGIDPRDLELRPIHLWRDARTSLTTYGGFPRDWTDHQIRRVLRADFQTTVTCWTEICARYGVTYRLPYPYPFRDPPPKRPNGHRR